MTTTNEVQIDPAVVAGLYLEHGDELKAFLIGVLKDHELAAEALQATFIKAMEQGHSAREETRKGWLFRVAFHEALAIKRRGKTYENNLRKMVWSRPQPEHQSPDDRLCRWETIVNVREALEKLPENQRAVVHLRIYEEKTFAQIAEELNLPLGTVLTRMRQALKKLQTFFDQTPQRGWAANSNSESRNPKSSRNSNFQFIKPMSDPTDLTFRPASKRGLPCSVILKTLKEVWFSSYSISDFEFPSDLVLQISDFQNDARRSHRLRH